ncbi:MAG: alpha-2-macroglobulin family protein [Candidatus Entotheonellia bacterium]
MKAGEPPLGPQVNQFAPQGTIKRVRQASARFSEPMLPVGDPRSFVDPFEIECPEDGVGRWIDSHTWVYDFARDLPGGVRCRFQLRPGLATQAGKAVTGQTTFTFTTGGPSIQTSIPNKDSTIDEDQAFVLGLDAQPTEESVLQHVSFAVAGLPEGIGLRLITGEAREAILKTIYGGSDRDHVLVLQARQNFPSGANVRLVWGKGVTAESGITNEQDQVLSFKVRQPFLAEFHCERLSRRAACLPITPMTLRFSTAVAWEQARRINLVSPSGGLRSPSLDRNDAGAQFVTSITFRGPFPEATTFRIEIPDGLTDDMGRPLSNASKFPLQVKTAEFPPLAKFAARFGIVEWKTDPTLPVTLRNLDPEVRTRLLQAAEASGDKPAKSAADTPDQVLGKHLPLSPDQPQDILAWLRAVATAARDSSIFGAQPSPPAIKRFLLPKPQGAKPLEVVGIPLEAPGLYIVELESPRLGASLLGKPQTMFVPTSVLVTNLSVHLKWGREASLIWVTALDAGRPVADAQVAVHDCAGKMLWGGQTDAQGIARVGKLPSQEALAECPYNGNLYHHDYKQAMAINRLDGGLFVIAKLDNDFSFTHSSWDRGIEPWRFQLPLGNERGVISTHTILDRSLFRAGDTVHMKHILREQTLDGFALVPQEQAPNHLSIRHVGSEEKYALLLRWEAGGIAENTWTIPKGAKLGRYKVVLLRQAAEQSAEESDPEQERSSGEFRVEEFRVPLMRGIILPPPEPQIGVSELPVELGVQYLAGGGARNLPVVLRAQIRPKSVAFPEAFEGFTFANRRVKEGVIRRGAGVGVGSDEDGDESVSSAPLPGSSGVHQRLDLVLDETGMARATITHLPKLDEPVDLLLELEYRDPNGEVQTVATSLPLWPTKWLVGVKTEAWVASKRVITTRVAVVDVYGQPMPNAPVQVDIWQRIFYSYRKRLVGGFYAYEHVDETRHLGELCQGVTNTQGLLFCEVKPPADGNLIVQASLTDKAGPIAVAHQEVWVPGARPWWFHVQDHDRIDLLPEKRRYEPGEIARFQVRMPFQEATALITTEREGVLDGFVVSLSGQEPVIEVPVREDFAPNLFISVLAVRGRVGDIQPTAMVDLGRPSFKLGIAEIRVGWRKHELMVQVTSDRTTYRVRDKALVRVVVRTADGQLPPAGSEVAVAAVDEGLLELLPNQSWNLLEAMMGRRGYRVQTATAQLEVVGKRHYGLKALPLGGGGGKQPTRELFDTLLFWQGRVPLDTNGEASLEIPLNDSLTSFRIVAMATGGLELFGTGSTSIRSTQDLMILSGIAPLVREGDQFRTEFTLRNTTDRAMDVQVKARVDGLPAPLAPMTWSLAPSQSQVIGWDLVAPAGVQALRYEVEAVESGGASDRIRVLQQVQPTVPIRTFQATISQWQRQIRQPVQRPIDALPDRGGVHLLVRSSIVEGLDGMREWMRRYPYSCLEQQMSRAVALRDRGQWENIAAVLPSHLDSDGLLKYFPAMEQGSEVLTAYALSIIHEAGWEVPAEVRERMMQGLQRFVEGAIRRRPAFPAVDLSLRKLAAVEALSRYTALQPQVLGSITLEPNLWPTSALLDWWSVLYRVPGIRDQASRLREAEQIVRSRLNLQGRSLGFSTERSDGLWWLMTSVDTNAVRLMLLLLEQHQWQEDLPRLLNGTLARQQRGRWDVTVANAWGALAVEKFSQAFEQTPVGGTTTASLANTVREVTWANTPQGNTFLFPWSGTGTTLTVDHTGAGHPWVTLEAKAAIPLKAPLASGYRLAKSLIPVEASTAGRFTRGDIVRVRLTIEADRDMTWVVVNDPIPAGASHLGTGLARDAQLAVDAAARQASARPAFEERAFDGFRAYYEFVPKGGLIVEYTMRLNQSGRFNLPPTRVEALYAPEMFGELPNDVVEVQP